MLVFHPSIITQLFIMLAHVQTFLVGLRVGGFDVAPSLTFKRYPIASLGPYITFGTAYFVVTLSSIFAAWLFLPVFLFMALMGVLTMKAMSFARRQVRGMPASMMTTKQKEAVVDKVRSVH